MTAVSITGRRFGNLLVKERAGSNKYGQSRWLCECVCGKDTIHAWANIKREGSDISCGCLWKTTFAETKICALCKVEKPHSEFGKRNARKGFRPYCVDCNQIKQRANYKINSTVRAKVQRGYRAKLRDAVLDAYGGKCSCCGESQKLFLAVDHINNDGAEQRREFGKGDAIYRWIKRNSYPTGFQILCANCNWGKHVNGGVCPHVG